MQRSSSHVVRVYGYADDYCWYPTNLPRLNAVDDGLSCDHDDVHLERTDLYLLPEVTPLRLAAIACVQAVAVARLPTTGRFPDGVVGGAQIMDSGMIILTCRRPDKRVVLLADDDGEAVPIPFVAAEDC
jgi:hypothetical protein